MRLNLARRVAILATTTAVAFASLTAGTAGAAGGAPDDAAAGWLGKQLTDGLIHNDQYDFDDYGLSADVGLALAEIGGHKAALSSVRRALAQHVKSWTTGVDFGSPDVYAGSTAKAVVFAQAVRTNPRSFGGVNLVRQLNSLVSKSGPTAGRIQDRAATDYANTIGQALAVRGLARAGSGKAGSALRFLLKQQCAKGYFRLNFAPAASGQQGCDAGSKAESAPDTDATAAALLSLQSLRRPSGPVRAAIKDGVAWLKRAQKSHGSFGGGTSTKGANTNSTGLAASALAGGDACQRAQRAARWIAKLQVSGRVAGTPLASEKGAIAYNRAALAAGREDGIVVETADQWRRATAQAAPALAYLSANACRS